jgi:2-C-methyl-D-erythritol 2,4-cyclodiphosphate synthase
LRNKNYTVINIDATIIAQMPKMAPYIEIMRSNVAKVLSLDKEYINIKATTEEGLGFTGAGQGIAANAITLIEKCENHC